MAKSSASDHKTSWTVTRICEFTERSRHAVEYIIDSRRITPIDRVGATRVFDWRDVQRIVHELNRIDAKREGVDLG